MKVVIDTSTKLFQHSFIGSLLLLAVVCFAAAVYSWDGPISSPPNSNTPAPVNVGTDSQVKDGGLWVSSLGVDGGTQLNGHVGIGGSPTSNFALYARGSEYGIMADATNGQAIRGRILDGGTGYAGFFDSYPDGSNAGGVFARNSNGYYAYLGYPGSSWSVYSNGPTYTGSYSRADGGFCIGGSCKSSWGQMGGYYWTGYVYIAAGQPTIGCASGYTMTGIGTLETNGDYRVDQMRILCTSLAP